MMMLVHLFPVFTMILLVGAQQKAMTICDYAALEHKNALDGHKINMSTVGIALQSLTAYESSGELLLAFHSMIDNIPMSQLNDTSDRLYFCPLSGRQRQKMSTEPVKHALKVLWSHEIVWFAIIAKDYIFVEALDTYYIFQLDGGQWCDSYDDKVMAWKLTTMKHPKEANKELWVSLKQVLPEKKASRRVVFTPMEMKVISSRQNSEGSSTPVTCNLVEFNLPGEDLGDFKPVERKGPFVFLETNADRSSATFVPSKQSWEKSYHKDLFALPPIVLVSKSKLYMVSLELGRVYVIPSEHLVEALEAASSGGQTQRSFPIRSMPWWVFFSRFESSKADEIYYPEPNQAVYLEVLGNLYPEEPFNLSWWLEDYAEELIIAALVVIITFALILFLYRRNVICNCFKAHTGKAINVSRKIYTAIYSGVGKSLKSKNNRRSKKPSHIDSGEKQFQNEVKQMLKIGVNSLSPSEGQGSTSKTVSSKSVNKTQTFSETKSKSKSSKEKTRQQSLASKSKKGKKVSVVVDVHVGSDELNMSKSSTIKSSGEKKKVALPKTQATPSTSTSK